MPFGTTGVLLTAMLALGGPAEAAPGVPVASSAATKATPATKSVRAAVATRASGSTADATQSLTGKVTMTNSRGRPSRLARPDDTLLFFTPDGGDQRLHGREPAEHTVETVGKQFEPRVLSIQRGDRVWFPNLDPILHNVFSVSGENRFDLEVYGRGESRSHLFEHAGLVRVFCNVHREMFAHIWVLETGYVTRPAPDGTFRWTDLPAGPGTLTVWHERAEPQELRVDPREAASLEIAVPLTRPRLPMHRNKYGRPYRRPGDYR